MESGFSSTSLCDLEEPTVVTMPLADTRDDGFLARSADEPVDIGAHGNTRFLLLVRCRLLRWPATIGVSITLGLTLILTACNTSRPARSIAVAFLKIQTQSRFFALRSARRWPYPHCRPLNNALPVRFDWARSPPLVALMSGMTMREGGIFLKRMPMRLKIFTLYARSQSRDPEPDGYKSWKRSKER